MAKNISFTENNRPLVSIMLVVGLTMIALFAGRWIKDNLENQTSQFERGGIQAEIARGWGVQNGIDGESMLFSTSDPFDLTHRFMVTTFPAAENHLLTDTVVNRNLDRGLVLQNYQVIEQTGVMIGSFEGFRVKYVYVDTPKISQVPVVVMGVDYYIPNGERVVVVSMEDQSSRFDEVYPDFIQFLNSLVISRGG